MINTTAFPAVAVTLWTLGAFSVSTWALIVLKGVQLVRSSRANHRFGKQFWSAPNLQAAADLSADKAVGSSAFGRIAIAGFGALNAAPHQEEHDLQHSWDRHELLQRNLAQQLKRERRTLDAGLAVLASIGSTAPFVGLFGTVWGIMSAMHNISKNGNASIDVVAGPIGDALIATGIGIAVAIPAVLAYNFFLRRLKSALGGYEDFAHDFLNLAQRATFRIERNVRSVPNPYKAA
ncbi:MAG TPA: MotA/TolQ/ExbB proton channel family protein [Steroidobacteraceae bacterium]|nr:MotA/TolQ/ExbB proton channel family protein [Steroidobacteraceae bacterium]